MKSWYSIKAQADVAEISIFEEIGFWGVTAKEFIDEFKAIKAPTVKVSINSPGGNVFDAMAIFNAMRSSGKHIEVQVLGVAASAASYIALAGDRVVMPENTFMFLHNPISGIYGNAEAMREAADLLDKIGASLTATYAKRWKGDDGSLEATLAAETFLTAAECLEHGLCDEVVPAIEASASFDLDRNMPDHVKAVFMRKPAEPAPAPEPTVTLAEEIVALAAAQGFEALGSVLATDASIKTLDDARAALNTAREISALCRVTGFADRADGMVRARKSLAEVRAAISQELVARDERTTIDNTLPSAAPTKPTEGFSASSMWDEIHAMKKGNTK